MSILDYKNWDIKKIVKEIAILAVMVLVISNVLSYMRQPDPSDIHLPQLNAVLIDGKQLEIKNLEGRPLMIHFWATWCPTCKAEADNIQRLSKYYNVVTIAVKSGSDEALNKYMQGRDFNYRVINDTEGRLAHIYRIEAFPTTFIYDRKGEIVFTEVGYSSTLGLALRMWWAGL